MNDRDALELCKRFGGSMSRAGVLDTLDGGWLIIGTVPKEPIDGLAKWQFNPDQPRDSDGRWIDGDADRATATNTMSTTAVSQTYDDKVSSDDPIAVDDDNTPLHGTSGMDVDAAVGYLNENAESTSTGYCAQYVEDAIDQGLTSSLYRDPNLPDAKDKGDMLLSAGFIKVPDENYVPQKGDVAIIQAYPGGNPAGHMAMWNGSIWVSDFKQINGIYPSAGYRAARPEITYYRP